MRQALSWFAFLDFTQEFGQLLQLCTGHVAELRLVQIMNRLIELFEQLQAFGSNAGDDHATVVLLTLAGDPALLFQAIEEAGHVRIAGDHALGNAAAKQSFAFRAAENAQDIVLSGSQAGGLDDLFRILREVIGGFQDGDEELVFERDGGVTS
jgi:hypothetical protein